MTSNQHFRVPSTDEGKKKNRICFFRNLHCIPWKKDNRDVAVFFQNGNTSIKVSMGENTTADKKIINSCIQSLSRKFLTLCKGCLVRIYQYSQRLSVIRFCEMDTIKNC